MDNKKAGGCAFPDPGRAQSAKQRENLTETGMSLRDYFAAQALAGMASQYHENWTTWGAAQAAYELADAMIAERVK